MQKDQENHFDDSIRRKLQEEEYVAPPFSLSMQQRSGSGFSWLRGFLLTDVILLLSYAVLSLNYSRLPNASNGIPNDLIIKPAQISNLSTPPVAKNNAVVQNDLIAEGNAAYNSMDESENRNSSTSATKTSAERLNIATSPSGENTPIANSNTVATTNVKLNSTTKVTLDYADANIVESAATPSFVSEVGYLPSDAQGSALVQRMNPLSFNEDIANDYTVRTRDFSHTPDVYRKPFALDIMAIGEKTLGYNRVYPELSQLNLDLTPRDNGFGAGILLSYRIVKRISILSGIETVFRKYNLNYNYTRSSMVQQPDGSYKEVVEVLTNSRSVSEAEVRLPFLATYTFEAKKWQFEPAAGFTIKFKNLNVIANGSDQIPAALLSTIEVSNDHLVTAGWMFSCLVGYQVFDNSIVFISPFYQAESFGKNSRQYYSGRAVSGAGLKAGMRILFYQP